MPSPEEVLEGLADDPYAGTGVKPLLDRGKDANGKKDDPAKDRAPRRGRRDTSTPDSSTPPATGTPARRTSLERRLTDMYVSLGTMLVPFDQPCATAVITTAPDAAKALDTLASENKKVKAALERMLEGGAWGGIMLAHAPIIVTVLAHHGFLPPEMAQGMGIEPKPRKPRKPRRSRHSESPAPQETPRVMSVDAPTA